MDNNDMLNNSEPLEKYSFRFDENEIKQIHKKQLRATNNTLIVAIIYYLVTLISTFISSTFDVEFGIVCGIFIMVIAVTLIRILAFKNAAKKSRETMPRREYIFSVFEKTLKIEVFMDGEKISEETRGYSEIQGVSDIKTHLLIAIAGRAYVIRKADIPSDSRLLLGLGVSIKKAKNVQKIRIIALVVLFICVVLMTISSFIEHSENNEISEYEQTMLSVLDKEYDEYELLTYFNVYKDEKLIDVLCLVEYGGEIDVLSYCKQNDENMVIQQFGGMDKYSKQVGVDLLDGSCAILGIYQDDADIPTNVSITQPLVYDNQDMYFCITFVE